MIWLLLSTANAFTLPSPMLDWAETEEYCSYQADGTCNAAGVSNDTEGNAFDIGFIQDAETYDTLTAVPSTLGGYIFGSDVATFSHAGDQLTASVSNEFNYYYQHGFDSTAGFEVDEDWYAFTTNTDQCLEVCLTTGAMVGEVSYPDDWTLEIRDSASAVQGTLVDPLGDQCASVVSDGTTYLYAYDPTPENYGTFASQPTYGFTITTDGIQHTWYPDLDSDGYGDEDDGGSLFCGDPGDGWSQDNTDCLDANTAIGIGTHPGAVDVCNSRDDDCDGDIDEDGVFTTYWTDADNDGFGDPGTEVEQCQKPLSNQVTNGDDCKDDNREVNPKATEVCDGVDNDCDGEIDEELLTAYYLDQDGDGVGSGAAVLACDPPSEDHVTDTGDCEDDDNTILPGADEVCDGIDNDCDGEVDEGLATTTYYTDADDDGYGAGTGVEFCSDPGDGWTTNDGDCAPEDPAVNPGATEVCNGIDDDCANGADDGLTSTTYYPDEDGDGYGDEDNAGTDFCFDPGDDWSTTNDDCDDAVADVNPGATEICNGVDDDCANGIDDGLVFEDWYTDSDGDGQGTGAGESLCEDPDDGRVTNDLDCDDTNADVYDGAVERCNGVDDDCDTEVDEDFAFGDYWPDDDGDGYGDMDASPTTFCDDPGDGWSENDTDCNDDDATIFPGADEVDGDGIDQDCDGDDRCDLDGDGYLDMACGGEDCNDLDPAFPEEEACQEATRWVQGGIGGCVTAPTGLMAWPLFGLLLVGFRRRR